MRKYLPILLTLFLTFPLMAQTSGTDSTDSDTEVVTDSNADVAETNEEVANTRTQVAPSSTEVATDKSDNVAAASGDITQNQFYKKSEEYRILARKALEAGDYKKSIEYSELGIKELDKFRGNNGILLASQQLRTARERGLDKTKADQYNEAAAYIESAKRKLVEGDYAGSVEDSDKALAILRTILGASANGLISEYTVVPGDCLWRIALKPQIYSDAKAWPRIYMANKNRLRYPDNPHLIYPNQVFVIPR